MKALLASLLESSLNSFQKLSLTHCYAIKCGSISDIYVSNRILDSYIKFGFLGYANMLFDEMPKRDSVSWNTMISGYTSCGKLEDAWCLFTCMKRSGSDVDGYSFSRLLKGIASVKRFDLGEQVHGLVIKGGYECNVYVGSSLVDMYAKCERVEDAFEAFKEISEPNSVSWNALIAGFVQVRDIKTAFWLLGLMEMKAAVTMDAGTFAPLLTLLDDPMFCNLLKQVHAKVLKLGLQHEITICNAMISSYADCGSVSDAKRVFDGLGGSKDLISWNSMIAGFSKHELKESAFELFIQMQRHWVETDIYTYTGLLSACSGEEHQIFGKSLHGMVIKKGLEQVTSATNALISMYIQFPTGTMEDALSLFESLKSKDLISWNSIITGFAQKGLSEDAVKFFSYLRSSEIKVDDYAFSALLRSCSDLATLQLGQQIHALATKSGFVSNEFVISSLIVMYSKCGIIESARKCFQQISSKHSTVAWNAMILGYAQHGLGQVSLDLFSQMCNQNVKLDHVTFTAILTACSHTGLIQEGLELLNLMEPVYKIQPRMEHYAAAVDLLGRAGLVNKAKELIESMPLNPDPMVLKTFLGVCRACGEIEMATQVANHLLEIEPEDHFTYVSLSHMYSDLKKWEEKASVKKMMKERGVKKVPGWSWIEIRNQVKAFNAEDRSNPLCQDIYMMIKDLTQEMQWLDSDNGVDADSLHA
ncbi:Pentatricopeptide repeat (PPR) superfamily protein [Arabidopsis thaliana]|uniref:Putative pentatricopeptide repeat-containing protein At3g25970 n=2 Tax=Arabidopsis thaliana TaxID=3702 RepID=PP255_ARATH|nr:Pentatricopeptide repeat (PPR) superfamily protein [Arabidopsis thaliana]Q9LU94.2 RecName: Full=Putative pentatricopeptide repeat-containing protein At3g25970 [Arabidopsis thaliana]AEE77096.1 Pentatricopeptide repeat (PPR) superfamily protein [Arabidopsis thaliana]|eukprot:NP_189226.2 Pentatricopeptide repeat (PPR) superfamily protein [Arabidopsis thaliana]